jgi:hypothetical protein
MLSKELSVRFARNPFPFVGLRSTGKSRCHACTTFGKGGVACRAMRKSFAVSAAARLTVHPEKVRKAIAKQVILASAFTERDSLKCCFSATPTPAKCAQEPRSEERGQRTEDRS